jgi:hypothetical protein
VKQTANLLYENLHLQTSSDFSKVTLLEDCPYLEIWRSVGIAPPFFTLAVGGASRPGRFKPWKITAVIHWIGSCEGPRAVLYPGEEENSYPTSEIEFRSQSL